MWLLEHEGSLFDRKRIWLRPGKSYLFGRTGNTSDQQLFRINHKSVSRQHLVLEISSVKDGDGSRPYSRSTVTLKDDSKFGTSVNDIKIRGGSHILTGKEHRIQLGNWLEGFKIAWHPVCLTFSFTEKQQKSAADVLRPLRDRFEQLDIKTIIPYFTDSTTHVVSAKRNIPKGLQALVNAKFIVNDQFLDAIAAAAQPDSTTDDDTASQSLLEQDFDANWPDEMKFLPDAGKEPNPRPPEFFRPKTTRSSVFEGYTFIFGDIAQYENLSPAINGGGAKCIQYDVQYHQTTVVEFADFVRSVGEQKGMLDLSNAAGRGIVVVRFRGKGDAALAWSIEFLRSLDKELGQLSVEQNQFLDAILRDDSSDLKVRTSSAIPRDISMRTEPVTADERPSFDGQELQASREIRRTVTKSKFKGFDNFDSDDDVGEPPSQLIPQKRRAASSGPESAYKSQRRRKEGPDEQEEDLFVAEDEIQIQQTPESQAKKTSRKRIAPTQDFEAHEDEMFPGAAAMRKRQMKSDHQDVKQESSPHRPEPATKSRNAKAAQTDVRSAAKSFAKFSDIPEEDFPNGQMGADEIAQLRDLVIIEDMDVAESIPRPVHDETSSSDPKWAGRQNFKCFRKQGRLGHQANRGHHSVIVRLEEVKSKTLSLGEDYMADDNDEKDRRRQGQGSDVVYISDGDENPSGRTNNTLRLTSSSSQRLGRRADTSQGSSTAPKVSSRMSSRRGRVEDSMRAAESSSDDGDELGIRFNRRRKG